MIEVYWAGNEHIDAYEEPKSLFSEIASVAITAGNTAEATLSASTVDAAIEAATVAMDENEVPMEDRVLFITPTVKSYLRQSDNYARNLNAATGGGIVTEIETYNGMQIVTVPQTRFYSAITLYDGTTGGQEAGGYVKAVGAADLNFIIASKSAVLGITKTALPRIFDPNTYQDANAWAMDYRIYHDIFVPDNKVNGIYAHTKPVA